MLGYDPQGKKYVHISYKSLGHRSNNYYYGGLNIYSNQNDMDTFCVGNLHDDYYGLYGTVIRYSDYNVHDKLPGTGYNVQLNAAEYFDQWITWDLHLEMTTGIISVKVNGTLAGTQDTPFIFKDKLIFLFVPYGWGTGHYLQLDDLLIESSDTAY